jgi:hypothetical protein
MNFISISGKAGSGKTTVSKYITNYFRQNGYSVNEFSFAGPLKDALCLWFNWDRQRLDTDFNYKEGDKLDDGSPDPYCQRLGMTRRTIMQKFGTECLREGLHQNFWIILADLGVYLGRIPPSDIYLISDARFINELEWVKSIGGFTIKITREETLTDQTQHASENDFLSWKGMYDISINNTIDKKLTQQQNMIFFLSDLSKSLLPRIKEKFLFTPLG